MLKDAIIFTHHGLEILLKAILSKNSELLVVQELDAATKQAFAEQRTKGLKSIFDTSVASDLRTVSISEAVERLEKICGTAIPKRFQEKLKAIVKLRNQVAHSNLSVEAPAVVDLFDQLLDLADRFFLAAFGKEYKTISGYDRLAELASDVSEAVQDQQIQTKQKTLQAFREAFDVSGISMGTSESKLVTNMDVATKFMDSVFKSDLKFGTDLFSGVNSGDVETIRRVSHQEFDIVARDIRHRWRFKFQSVIIWMTSEHDLGSPILLLVSDTVDTEFPDSWDTDTSEFNGRYVDGIKFRDSNDITWDRDEQRQHYLEAEYAESTTRSREYSITYYLDGGLFSFLNVQGLYYSKNLRQFLTEQRSMDPKEIEVRVRDELKLSAKRPPRVPDST